MFTRKVTQVTNNLLSNKHFIFRKSLGTENSVHTLSDVVARILDAINYTMGVFLDLSKAFGTHGRQFLLHKLSYNGINGAALSWFRSYLSGRPQNVGINEECSSLNSVELGLAQRNGLSPFLLILFVNDFVRFSPVLNFIL